MDEEPSCPHADDASVEALPVQRVLAQAEPQMTAASLETARDLSREGNCRQALDMYRAFLSAPTFVSQPAEVRAYVLSQTADVENGMGTYAESEAKAREAIRLLEAAGKTQTSMFAIAAGALADALGGEGNYVGEKSVAEYAVSIGRQTLNPLPPRLAILLTILARAGR